MEAVLALFVGALFLQALARAFRSASASAQRLEQEIYEKEQAFRLARLVDSREEEFDEAEAERFREQLGYAQKAAAAESKAYGFLYFARNGDLYKIGITENLQRRMKQVKPDEILNVVRCSNFKEVERELHARFKEVRIPQTEYFRLTLTQIQQVHRLMSELADI